MRFIGPGTVIVKDSKNEKGCECPFDDHVDIYADKDVDLYKCKDCIYKYKDDDLNDIIPKLFEKIYNYNDNFVMFLDVKNYRPSNRPDRKVELLTMDTSNNFLRISKRIILNDTKIIRDIVNNDEDALKEICECMNNTMDVTIPFRTSNKPNMKGVIMQQIIDCIHIINNSKLCEDNFRLEIDGVTITFSINDISVCEEHLNYNILTYTNKDLRNKLCNIILKNGKDFFFDISHARFVELPDYKFSVVK